MTDRPEATLIVLAPEGTELHFALAEHGARAAAFLIDFTLMCLIVVALSLLTGLSGVGEGDGWSTAVGYLFFFLVRQFWFVFFEIRWHGQTPGKRSQRLRVVEARGGALRPEAILARNLTRDLEIFLPLMLVLAPEAVFPGVTGGARWAAGAWGLLFAFLPLFNRHRMRVGDLVGGTRVVAAPKGVLLADLGVTPPGGLDRSLTAPPVVGFSPAMLEHYGIFELQKLEAILRASEPRSDARALAAQVSEKIRHRIGWPATDAVEPLTFLRAFYAAQRAHLEQKALMGDRIEDKRAARERNRSR